MASIDNVSLKDLEVINIIWNQSLYYPNKDKKWGIYSVPFWEIGKNKNLIFRDTSQSNFVT